MNTIRHVAILLAIAGATDLVVPTTPREPVVDVYHGRKITDPYRWMEDRNAPRFVSWLEAQDAYARARLAAIPGRDALLQRVTARNGAGAVVRNVRLAGTRVFYLKREAGEDRLRLFVRDGADERLLVDAGEGNAIDHYEPSHDGSLVAYGVSSGGSEESVLAIVDVATGRRGKETISGATAEPSWTADGMSFYYNRLAAPRPEAKPSDTFLDSRVYLHVAGTDPSADTPILGTGVAGSVALTPVEMPFIRTTPGSDHLLATTFRGADATFALYVAPAGAGTRAWRKVADYADGVIGAELHGSLLFLLIRGGNAPRGKVVAVDANAPDLLNAKTIVPSDERVIQGIAVASDALYVSDLDGGLGKVRRYGFSSAQLEEVRLPIEGAVTGPITARSRAVLFAVQNWITPPQWFRRDGDTVTPIALGQPWRAPSASLIVEETKAKGWDGTAIPLSIVRRRDTKLDGSSPAWLVAYGAYGISLTPSYSGLWGTTRVAPLLEDGGVYAVCHARGGGEYGQPWHLAGKQATKPNSWKDLIACAEHLIANGYTRSSALAIEGSSAGGLTVSMAAMTRPDLFRVVFSRVGDNNPLRLDQGADGPAMAAEFGTTRTKEGFEALLAADPTQHVRNDINGPAFFLTAGFNDPRVAPWHPAKLAAHLQHARPKGRPVLLRVDFEGGHGPTSRRQADEEHADMLAFFYWQIGRTTYQPRAR
jgi:prolyl oligopeptidase